MNRDEILALAKVYVDHFDKTQDDLLALVVMAMEEVERETRHRFFSHVQAAINAASNRVDVKRVLDKAGY